jgi:hypothetical protein
MYSSLKKQVFSIVCAIVFFSGTSLVKAQQISPYLIGNNAWYDGYALASIWDDMAVAKFQSIRIGGNAAEGYGMNYAKYINLIDGVRLANAEPILQVPRDFTTQQTIDFITYINVTKGKNIKLWSIGNEPDHTNNFDVVSVVSEYTKRIGSALKSVDSTIITMGPETSWYQNTAYMTPLIGGNMDITGKDAAGHYYIDVVTFHKYMFTETSSLESDVDNLLAKFKIVNANRPEGKKLSWGLTEFNSTYDNDKNTSPDQNVWSFHAGQLYAEVYGLGMRKGAYAINAWSMLEGATERAGTDLSLFDKDFKGRANYYHSLMLAQNYKQNYVTTSDNKGNVVVIPMADSTGIAIMILNKDHATAFDYTLRLDNGTFDQTNPLQIKVNAGKAVEIKGSIAKEATQMLVMDTSGVLLKRYTYTAYDADGRGEPLIEYFTDDAVPLVTLTQPTVPSTIALKTSIDLAADASDNGTIVKVEFAANGALIGTSTVAPYTYKWTPKLAGTFSVAARAYDNMGGVGFSESQTIIVEKIYTWLPVTDTLQAENFDAMLGIQLETTTDIGGGKNIGYCDLNDWMDYTVNVPASGQYKLQVRVASLNATGAFSLKKGTTVLASFALNPGTGGWQIWKTLEKVVTLTEGNQTLRVTITGPSININWLKFSLIPVSVNTPTTSSVQIYPNPSSSGNFYIMLNGFENSEQLSLEIFKISGQKVYSEKLLAGRNGSFEFRMKENKKLEAGLYIVSVQSKAGLFREQLLVE